MPQGRGVGSTSAPGDAEIRKSLRKGLEELHGRQDGSVLLEELGICGGQARVDMALVNGVIHAFEIKSDLDSLRRLPQQVSHYGRVVDRATLVVGTKHLEDAAEIVPDWWGVTKVVATATGIGFEVVRAPLENPKRDARALIELLWRDETVALLESEGLDQGFRGKPRDQLWDHASSTIALERIGEAVRTHLKAKAGELGRSAPE